MKLTAAQEMEAGRGLDVLIAEKVMEEEVALRCWGAEYRSPIPMHASRGMLPPKRRWRNLPKYSTDISAAWEVVEKMWQLGWWATVQHQCVDGTWECDFYKGNDRMKGKDWYSSLASSAPLAICSAALQTKGVPR